MVDMGFSGIKGGLREVAMAFWNGMVFSVAHIMLYEGKASRGTDGTMVMMLIYARWLFFSLFLSARMEE